MSEYKVVESERNATAEEEELNRLASEGWELVSTVSTDEGTIRLYLKRAKK